MTARPSGRRPRPSLGRSRLRAWTAALSASRRLVFAAHSTRRLVRSPVIAAPGSPRRAAARRRSQSPLRHRRPPRSAAARAARRVGRRRHHHPLQLDGHLCLLRFRCFRLLLRRFLLLLRRLRRFRRFRRRHRRWEKRSTTRADGFPPLSAAGLEQGRATASGSLRQQLSTRLVPWSAPNEQPPSRRPGPHAGGTRPIGRFAMADRSVPTAGWRS